jgi:nicotinamide riboside kinase
MVAKVINFYGGPSAGKSTMSAQLFGIMKAQRLNVEYVPEFAKELTWKKSNSLDDQLYVMGNQHHMIYTLRDQVDFIITDSPMLLTLHYSGMGMSKFGSADRELVVNGINAMALALYSMYDNADFYVVRGNRKFIQAGRNQNEEQAKGIDMSVKFLLDQYKIDYTTVNQVDQVAETLGIRSE